MKYYNLKDNSQVVDFKTAVKTGLGNNQGLFFPKSIQALNNINDLLALDVHQRNFQILKPFVNKNIDDKTLKEIIAKTFSFPAKLAPINNKEFCLELFHGPTLAFKDFGANFMANCLQSFSGERAAKNKPVTILTATSGDTGAAVAHAFYGLENIKVVILFPRGKISELQQKMFTTLGKNIHTVAIDGSFDDCQELVKQCFEQPQLKQSIGLNSANSINISRLLAQVCYYFDAFSQLPVSQRSDVVVSVPCGNFGNLCAGIIAKTLGLPIKRFIASTNINDTVPRYLETGEWSPKQTIATLSNAMDVSKPNNWPRIAYLMETDQFDPENLFGISVTESETQTALISLYNQSYLSEPHAAVAYYGLNQTLQENETGLFLGTAHPAKFKSTVERILKLALDLPKELASCHSKLDQSIEMPCDFEHLEKFLMGLKADDKG